MKPASSASTQVRPRSRWLPHPVGSLVLGLLWLVIAGELNAGQIVIAVATGLVLPHVTERFGVVTTRVASWPAVWKLAGRVTVDIVTANLAVARLVLGNPRRLRPGFVIVPVELEHPTAIALFAGIITMTPGTVSCVVERDRREILVHVLDLDDPVAAVADMKARYETPLREIFGC